MKRILYLLFFLAFPVTGFSQELYQEGKHYTVLGTVQPVETGDKVEVREMFWYGCPHCFRLEDRLESWVENMPEGSGFVRMPAIFSDVWEQHAKLYYTLQAMGEVDNLHRKVFDAIHVENESIVADEEIINFAVKHGLEKSLVEQTLSSFSVMSKINAAKVNVRKYQVTGVPAIVVAGKYLTDVSSAGSEQNLFLVVEYLINKAKSES